MVLMEPEVRERFDEIWAVLREVAARQNAADLRMDRAEQRMEKSDQRWAQRIEKSDQKWAQRMDLAEQRMEKSDQRWDKRFESTRKLVEAGIGIVNRLGRRQSELEKFQKSIQDSLRKGNSNGRKRG